MPNPKAKLLEHRPRSVVLGQAFFVAEVLHRGEDGLNFREELRVQRLDGLGPDFVALATRVQVVAHDLAGDAAVGCEELRADGDSLRGPVIVFLLESHLVLKLTTAQIPPTTRPATNEM